MPASRQMIEQMETNTAPLAADTLSCFFLLLSFPFFNRSQGAAAAQLFLIPAAVLLPSWLHLHLQLL